MTNFVRPLAALVVVAVGVGAPPALAQTSEQARIDHLERELAAVRAEVAAMKAAAAAPTPAPANAERSQEDRLAEVERRIEILAEEIERGKLGDRLARPPAVQGQYGLGAAASKVYEVESGISLGGYGELLYENVKSTSDDGARRGSDRIDLLRGVLYAGYKFNDRWLFNSEIEFEHAGATGSRGEVSLELAYIDYLLKPTLNVRAGLLLVPMGFINELHEPPAFLGARRPDVERQIIPTTWRENGIGIFGDLGQFSYRTYLLNGLEAEGFSASGIRGGRQKGSQARAQDFAWSGRLDYTGRPGLLVGVSAYRGDSGQGLRDPNGATIGASTEILDAHLEWKHRGFELRALAARGEIDDVARLNQALGRTGESSIGEELGGYYLQLGYDVLAPLDRGERSLTPYLRIESYDTQRRVPAGFLRDPARRVDVLTLGLAFKPLTQLIVKADFQDIDNDAGTGTDQFNLALGYLF